MMFGQRTKPVQAEMQRLEDNYIMNSFMNTVRATHEVKEKIDNYVVKRSSDKSDFMQEVQIGKAEVRSNATGKLVDN